VSCVPLLWVVVHCLTELGQGLEAVLNGAPLEWHVVPVFGQCVTDLTNCERPGSAAQNGEDATLCR